MEKTYNVVKAIQAQKDYCKEYASNYPKRWTSAFMKEGKGFAPENGFCWRCHNQIYSEDGFSVEEARSNLITFCPFCLQSFAD